MLGKIGRNFAAGTSGGTAYVLDFDREYCNTELVKLEGILKKDEQKYCKVHTLKNM